MNPWWQLAREAVQATAYLAFIVAAVLLWLSGRITDALLCMIVLGLMDVERAIKRRADSAGEGL